MGNRHSPVDIDSLWRATSVARPEMGPLSGDKSFDVAIIGGGYTGLSTARYLAKAGLSPVVLEANRIGWGASGRNGGVVSGKYRTGVQGHRRAVRPRRRAPHARSRP